MIEIILVQGFCPLKIKITQFPNGFLNCCNLIVFQSKNLQWNAGENSRHLARHHWF